ncbi:MAG: hypothetical protein PVJ09_00535 [Candidatus Woesebacteria bacterium]|jgi:hypothetical protein
MSENVATKGLLERLNTANPAAIRPVKTTPVERSDLHKKQDKGEADSQFRLSSTQHPDGLTNATHPLLTEQEAAETGQITEAQIKAIEQYNREIQRKTIQKFAETFEMTIMEVEELISKLEEQGYDRKHILDAMYQKLNLDSSANAEKNKSKVK